MVGLDSGGEALPGGDDRDGVIGIGQRDERGRCMLIVFQDEAMCPFAPLVETAGGALSAAEQCTSCRSVGISTEHQNR